MSETARAICNRCNKPITHGNWTEHESGGGKTYAFHDDLGECYGTLEGRASSDVKLDRGKVRPDLIPADAELGIAAVLAYGAKKYPEDSWDKIPGAKKRYVAAYRRHMLYWTMGEINDPESQLPHLDHAICNLLFLSALEKRGQL